MGLDVPVIRLMLGTAQWGNSYGATNTVGRITDSGISDIVAVAREWGIDAIDTAPRYGDAERRLRPHAHGFAITTKVSGADDVTRQVLESQRTIGVSRLHAVLVHDWDEIDADARIQTVRTLGRLLEERSIDRAGVSVYDEGGVGSAIEAFTKRRCPLGALQVPANVLDRRLDMSQVLTDLAADDTEIVVRSVFLQGILLAQSGGRADHPDVVRFRTWAASHHSDSLMAACLSHIRALPWAQYVTIGVTSAPELSEVCEAWASTEAELAPDEIGSTDLTLIDPRRW